MANFTTIDNIDIVPTTVTSTSSANQGKNVLPQIGTIMPYAGKVFQRLSATTSLNISSYSVSTPTTGLLEWTTASAHGYMIGDSVTVSGASVSGLNATYIICGISSTTKFTVVSAETTTGATGASVIANASKSVPSGWLLCNGDTFSSSTYPLLNSTLSSTTLPDLRGKYLVGSFNSLPLGSFSNTSSHTHNANATGTLGNWAPGSHGHSYNAWGLSAAYAGGAHNHGYSGSYSVVASGGANSVTGTGTTNAIGNHSHGTITGNIGDSGTTANAVQLHDHNTGFNSTAAGDANFSSNGHNHTSTFTQTYTSNTTYIPGSIQISYLIKADS